MSSRWISSDSRGVVLDMRLFPEAPECKFFRSAVGNAHYIVGFPRRASVAVTRCARCLARADHSRIGASCCTIFALDRRHAASRSRQRRVLLGNQFASTCWVDSGWARHHVSRRSCSGGLYAWSDAVITSWARMRATPAISTQSDLSSSTRCSSKHLLEELGRDVLAEVRTDSQVDRSVVLSQGLRKRKLRFLFVQEVKKRGEISTSYASTI